MESFILVHDSQQPPVYLVYQVPGLALALIGPDQWLAMALGAPRFSGHQESYAQQFMRRHGLDRRQYDSLEECAEAVRCALLEEL
jgi:hypothetical protein